MPAINILEQNVYEKIAAGEVIERPSAVVKELVENAIDAHSTSITVDIRNGGLDSIRVTDNGCGMDETDAKNAFLPHATSKISKEADLFAISSLGFRGEALSSISAVSEVQLVTRMENADSGVLIIHRAGELVDVKPAGCPDGTSITVKSLFYNIPARLKFLKKPSIEAGYISDLMQRFILSRPEISFHLKSEGQTIYHSPGSNDLQKAIWAVYGADVHGQLKTVEYRKGDLHIYGYAGTPEISRANRSRQTLFVNNRYVQNQSISQVVQKAYSTTMMVGKFPFYVLNIDIPYSKTDVNVHPNKMEVRFTDENEVLEAFFGAIQSALFSKSVADVPKRETPKPTPDISGIDSVIKTDEVKRIIEFSKPDENQTSISKITADVPMHSSMPVIDLVSKDTKLGHSLRETALLFETEQTGFLAKDFDYRLIGELFKTYVLLEADEKLIIIDQHAAHERLRYDSLKKQVERGEPASQLLMIPHVFDVTALEQQAILDNLNIFICLGFDIESFGNLTLKVSAVPHILGEPQIKGFFNDVLDNINTLKSPKTELKRDAMMQWACKHSVRAGDMLAQEEIIHLLRLSAENDSPLTCPHGRPIMKSYTRRDIEKMFKRSL